jgi:hypothetical protein
MYSRPSKFVLSDEGNQVQKRIWAETNDLLKNKALEARLPNFDA